MGMLCWPENLGKGILSKANYHILKTNLHAKPNLAEMWQFDLKSCPNLGSLEGRNEHFFCKNVRRFFIEKIDQNYKILSCFHLKYCHSKLTVCSKVLAYKWRIRTYSFKCIRVLKETRFIPGGGKMHVFFSIKFE